MNDSLADFPARHPLLLDLVWMVCIAALGAVVVSGGRIPYDPFIEFAFSVGLLLPLLWRRRFPLLVFGTVSTVACAQIVMEWPLIAANVGLAVALYSVASRCPLRFAVAALVVACVGHVIWSLTFPSELLLPILMVPLLIIFLVWTAGRYAQAKQLVAQGLHERALLSEEARERDASEAVISERLRIARELHDTVAHNVSVMVMQAEGARLVMERDLDTATKALQQVAESGRAALADMREMVAMMRHERIPPWSQRIDALVHRMEHTGLHVDLHREGEPPQDAPEIGETVYNVVRESLTNVLKHAGPGAHATVRLSFTAEGVDVSVEDDGAGTRIRLAPGGHGLAGMRERVSTSGGSLDARPRRTGGYVVSARLPYGQEGQDAA